MSHNDFMARSWHLPEYFHPINWATREMCRTIRRRDPRKPGFWYLSFSAPHPPMMPLQDYMDLYAHLEIDRPIFGDWSENPDDLPFAVKRHNVNASVMVGAPWREQELARRAFYATLTHIDHQIRLVIGLLREEGILNDTILVFTSDHGHMIGEHGLWCMRQMYEMCTKIPLFIVPVDGDERFEMGAREDGFAEFGDLMPTLLDMCGLPVPDTVDGIVLGRDKRACVYAEHYEDARAMRMIRADQYKLIYYATGNRFQFFDIENDPRETMDLVGVPEYADDVARLKALLMDHLYGSDLEWIQDGELVGLPDQPYVPRRDRGLMGQRGLRFL